MMVGLTHSEIESRARLTCGQGKVVVLGPSYSCINCNILWKN